MEKSKSRKLEEWEETYYGRLIAETNPIRLQPKYREIFEGIRDWWNKCLTRGNGICLSEKQLSAVKRCSLHRPKNRGEAGPAAAPVRRKRCV